MPSSKARERDTNRVIEQTRLPKAAQGYGANDPQIWFGLDDAGHRNARNIRDLAKAIRQRNFADAELCLDLLARDDAGMRDEIALGRQAA